MKNERPISFIIPAYNCEGTLDQAVDSIILGNNLDEKAGDEIIIVNDGSTDDTASVIGRLELAYKGLIRSYSHKYNAGGGAARNTAVQNAKYDLIFCLDSDNILASDSILMLKLFMLREDCDAAGFGEMKLFRGNNIETLGRWILHAGITKFADVFTKQYTLPASGNYLYTKESWIKAGGYPCDHFLDTLGFGVRQLATGAKMCVMPKSYYRHRVGHASYWIREDGKGNTWWAALSVILPHFDRICPEDQEYILGKGRNDWLKNRKEHPIRFIKEVNNVEDNN